MGLVALLALGAALALAAAVTAIVRDARHPSRATVGWALARGLATHPSEAGMEASEGTVTCTDGTALPMWTVTGGSPEGPALLLLHGWRRSRIDSLRRLPWLLPHVRFACVLDLRGHGDAPAGPSTLGAADVADACAAVRTRPEVPWVVAGHSLGASVAVRAAAALQASGTPIVGALLMCPYPDVRVPLTGRLSHMGMPAFPAVWIAARAVWALCGRETPIEDSLRVIGSGSIPTVWITCTEDAIVPPDAVRALHARARAHGSQATLLVDSDADHDSIGTGHPSWTADAVAALGLKATRAEATTP
jgi:pimeloyl-ACP methyl ester carboxylesterase